MPKRRRDDDFDSPWKDALQFFFRPFLALFFLDIHDDIDWKRGYESLDKEFQQVVRRANIGKRLADKLFKIWLRNGEEKWILIHVEIQAESEKGFPERMFNYNTAIWHLHRRDVVSLAVLCDDSADWRPTSFAYGRWGCRTEVAFRIAKLLDFRSQEEWLDKSTNAFAMIVLAHLKTLATRHDEVGRREGKFRLVKTLLRGKLSKEEIRQLIRLIDWMMTLPDDLEEAFRSDVQRFEEENKMEFISIFERAGYEKGHQRGLAKGEEEGRAKGHKEGHEKGREEGLRLGLLESIEMDLDVKFGVPGRKLLKKAKAMRDLDALRQFAKFLKQASSIRAVNEFLE